MTQDELLNPQTAIKDDKKIIIVNGISLKSSPVEVHCKNCACGQCFKQHSTSQDVMNAMTKSYRKKNLQLMRPYIAGEDLTGISVNKEDTPELGGMIAVNTANSEDRWYVAKQFFDDNYEEV